MWIALVAMLVGSAVTTVVGHRGATGTLPRNHVAGLRTSATLASDQAWAVGNSVAGPYTQLTGAGAVVATLGATAVALVGASESVVLAILLTIAVFLLCGVVVGAVAGHRAAREILAAAPAPDAPSETTIDDD